MYMNVHIIHVLYATCMHVRETKEGRKKEASKVKQTNKAKQHSTPKAVTFPKKNELPRVGLEPTTLHTLDRALDLYIHVCIYIMYIVHSANIII